MRTQQSAQVSQNSTWLWRIIKLPFVTPLLLKSFGMDWNTLTEQGKTAFREGRYQEAQAQHELALLVARKYGANHVRVGHSLNYLGLLCHQQAHYADAALLFERTLAIFESTGAATANDIANVVGNLGSVYLNHGRYPEAEAQFLRALTLKSEPERILTYNNLGQLYTKQERYEEAETAFGHALELAGRKDDPENAILATIHNNLGALYQAQKRYGDAEQHTARALALYEQRLGPVHPRVARVYNNWGAIHLAQEHFTEAEPLLHRAVEITEKANGRNSPVLLAPLNNLADLLTKTGRAEEAAPIKMRLQAIRKQNSERSQCDNWLD